MPFGITDFQIKTEKVGPLLVPEGSGPAFENFVGASIKNIRTDVAPGVVTNPEAITKCSQKDFESTLVEPKHKFYLASKCPASSLVGENIVLTAVPEAGADVTLTGKVYNLEQPFGLASDFGVALDLSPLGAARPLLAHVHRRQRGMA